MPNTKSAEKRVRSSARKAKKITEGPYKDALIKADKDFDLLVVPGRSHDTFIPYVERRGWQFLVEHLDAGTPRYHQQTAASVGN